MIEDVGATRRCVCASAFRLTTAWTSLSSREAALSKGKLFLPSSPFCPAASLRERYLSSKPNSRQIPCNYPGQYERKANQRFGARGIVAI